MTSKNIHNIISERYNKVLPVQEKKSVFKLKTRVLVRNSKSALKK